LVRGEGDASVTPTIHITPVDLVSWAEDRIYLWSLLLFVHEKIWGSLEIFTSQQREEPIRRLETLSPDPRCTFSYTGAK